MKELDEIQSKLLDNLNSLCGEMENDLNIKNQNISRQLSQLQSNNEKLRLEISDKKHGLCLLIKPSYSSCSDSFGNEIKIRGKQAENSRTCSRLLSKSFWYARPSCSRYIILN